MATKIHPKKEEILQKYDQGESALNLSKEYAVSYVTIHRWVNERPFVFQAKHSRGPRSLIDLILLKRLIEQYPKVSHTTLLAHYNKESPTAVSYASFIQAVQKLKTSKDVRILYTNYKGEQAYRTIQPQKVYFGRSAWHPVDQWLLIAFDREKLALRHFAMKDIQSWEPFPSTQVK